MSTQSLMDRARQLMNPKAVGAALVIVPLAMAVPAQGDTVFTSGLSGVNNIISGGGSNAGGAMGNAYEAVDTLDQHNVTLTGNTVPPNYSPSGFLLEEDLNTNAPLDFTWKGGFAGVPSVDDLVGKTLSIGFEFDSTGYPALVAGNTELSWSLFVTVYSSDTDLDPEHTLLYSETDGSGVATQTYPAPGPIGPTFTSGTPVLWDVELNVFWDDPNLYDTLSFSPKVVLSLDGEVGGNETPLPATFWTGSTMLALLGGFYIIRRRPKAAC